VDDLAVVKRAVAHQRVDTVFHLAAQSQVRDAYRDPFETFESNVRGTYTLLEACRLNRDLVERVVVASSVKAYGEADELPYTEETPLRAVYPYDASKAAGETVARSYAATYGLKIAIARCGNIFGGGDLNWDRLVPGTIRSLLDGVRPVIRSNGKLVRDYFYVRDAVHAYLTLADALPRQDVINQAFNFSMSAPLAVLDVLGRIQKVMGHAHAAGHRPAFRRLRRGLLLDDLPRRRERLAPAHTYDHQLCGARRRIKLVLFDDREGSRTKGTIEELYIGDGNYVVVQVPPLVCTSPSWRTARASCTTLTKSSASTP
jgi:nucleoside-diphosphate-sugar epimerase